MDKNGVVCAGCFLRFCFLRGYKPQQLNINRRLNSVANSSPTEAATPQTEEQGVVVSKKGSTQTEVQAGATANSSC